MDDIEESAVAPQYGGEGAVVADALDDLVRQQQIFMFPSDVADADRVRH